MKVVRPVLVTGASLVSSSIPENDYPAWAAGTTYAIGERVISTTTHRVYESAIGGNIGHDPAGAGAASWSDTGATNRWAMFDPTVGGATTTSDILTVTIAPTIPVDSIGFVDLIASYVRVQVTEAGATLYDRTRRPVDGEAASTTLTFLDLPAVAGAQIVVTAVNDSRPASTHFFGSVGQKWGDTAPIFGPIASGVTSIGTVVIGKLLDLGDTEDKPSVSITDYSVRQTDDFGVTTVVPRTWAKRITAKSRLDSSVVDAVQLRLADIRARPALWIGEEGFEALTAYGFYKDFSAGLTLDAASYCTLTIEGLPTIDLDSLAFDPAPAGASDLQVIDPLIVTDTVLTSSSVAENDAPAWTIAASYALGARVLRQHRVYESLISANVGNDPAAITGKWLDTGPANRWAMFDQALGTITSATGQIVVTLQAGEAVTGLAVLDAHAATVRVQASGYDRTQAVVADGTASATLLFLDLAVPAGGTITVTIAGAASGAAVAVGTLLVGTLRGLGQIEISPSVGIKDYSVKSADAFGNVSVVERAWAKQMALRSIVATESTGMLLRRFARLRARPALWIGHDGLDSLTIYGFFRDCSMEIGRSVTLCSLSIEGLSQAAQPSKVTSDVTWDNLSDPNGTKPADNATNGADPDSPFGPGQTIGEANALIAAAKARQDTLENVTIPAINAAGAQSAQRITEARAAADLALSTIESEVDRVDQRIDNISVSGGYDDTSVRAEINRVDTTAIGRDAGLTQSIQMVSASLTTTDSSLRALVQTKETAAVDRETVISQRVDQLIAQGGGGSEGVDIVARSEVSRVEQASVLRDTALGSRTTQVEASADGASGALNANASFALWPAAQALPTGYNEWPAAYGHAFRATDGLGINTNADEGGVLQEMARLTPGAYVIEARVKRLAFATFLNTGIAIHLLDDDGQGTGRFINYHFFEDAQIGVQDRWYTFSRYVEVPDYGYLKGRAIFHVMGRWGGFSGGLGSANNSVWAFARVRPASAGEIKAQKADATLIPALAARIKTTEDTLVDLPNRYATAQRATNIEASVGNVAGRVGGVEAAVSDGRFATAQRVANVEATAGDLNSRVSTTEGAIAGLGVRQAAYWRVLAVAGGNRAQLTVSADANGGAGVDIVGDVAIDGNLMVSGTIVTDKIAPNAVTQALALVGGSIILAPNNPGAIGYGPSISLTAAGGQVRVDVSCDTNVSGQGTTTQGKLRLLRTDANGEVAIGRDIIANSTSAGAPNNFFLLDTPAAGAVSYRVRLAKDSGTQGLTMSQQQLVVTEFKR